MTGTSTAGADWKGGGEIKAVRRIVGGSAEEDEDVLAPVGHNRSPQGAVHESTAVDIDIEEQARIVERAFQASESATTQSDNLTLKLGRELIVLQKKWRAAHGIPDDGRARPGFNFGRWAAERFGRAENTIRRTMSLARDPQRYRKYAREEDSRKKRKQSAWKRLVEQVGSAKGARASTVKKALISLEKGERAAIGCWIISLDAGSDDPQEIARWFAAHRLV